MKNTLLILTCLLYVVLVKAQEIDNQQWTVITKRTATWCTFCGGYGWTMFEGLQEEFTEDDDVLLIAAHYSGDLQNQAAKDIVANFGGSGQPTFFLNNDNMSVNSNNVNAKIQEARQTVDLLNSFDPFASIGVEATYYGNQDVEVNAIVQFNTDLDGEFYLGLYEIANNIIANQANQGPNTLHKRVLTRQLISDEGSFGKLISSGEVSSGAQLSLQSSFPLTQETIDDLQVAAILWNKVGNNYVVFNATLVDIFIAVSTLDELAAIDKFNISQMDDQLRLDISSAEDFDQISLSILGLDGREVMTRSASIVKGRNEFEISTADLIAGIYLVTIRSERSKITKRVFIR